MKTIIVAIGIVGIFSFSACNTTANQERETALENQRRTIDSLNTALARKQAIDSMNEINSRFSTAGPNTTTVQVINPDHNVPVNHHRDHYGHLHNQHAYAGGDEAYVEPAPAPHKKGWSAKAKGAVIGAGIGGVTGAVVNGRNRAAGAVIGTLIGAAAGTGTGAIIDKKKGR